MNELLLPYDGRVEFESRYGYRELNGKTVWHNGIDLVGLDSKTILSPCEGTVKSSTIITDTNDNTWEWGNYVRIDYKDISIYLCHMSKRLVEVGDHVYPGQPIGIEGNTGYSFGSHCHFECRRNNCPFNPCDMLGIYNGYGIYQNKEIDGIHDWSKDAVKWAIRNGILKGYSNSGYEYKLSEPITREEMIVFLYRFYTNLN